MNLYPFRQTVTAADAPSYETAVENIDIGGPAMIRAAAKNHEHVTVVVDPSDYQELLEGLKSGGGNSLEARKKLAWKAYQHTATYDSTVAEWFWSQIGASCTLDCHTWHMGRESSSRRAYRLQKSTKVDKY